jgi:uncharacterized damage-inducible protein DinB
MDLASYYRTEVEAVGRRWRELLAGFDDAAARHAPAPTLNHALWLTGHITWAQDYFIHEIPTGQSVRRTDWDVFFDLSSEKLAPEEYPPFAEVRAEFIRVHEETMRALAQLGERDLRRPPKAERRWFPTVGEAVAHFVTQAHYHLGQLSCLARLR